MPEDQIVNAMFLIFSGAALIATIALYCRQALLVAYIVLGLIAGPSVSGLITDPSLIQDMAHVGIIFLLFLLGLDLEPQELLHMLRNTTRVTIISSTIFALSGLAIGLMFGYSLVESAIIAAALMFSSTIIGLKLLPTTALHHQHTGEIMISVLLLQDLIAIIVLMLIQGLSHDGVAVTDLIWLFLSVPLLVGASFLFARHVLHRLISRFDQIQEYIFLLAIGWCLGMAELATVFELSHEIGAFIAGVTLATSPIARFIAESLRPLRDFFLIMFFFSLGAGLDLSIASQVLLPAAVIAVTMLVIKPWVFARLLIQTGEKPALSKEIGCRLGQISEFSLLIAILALDAELIREETSYLIQIATLLTFTVSSYLIVMRFPTPIAISEHLRRN
ncbi:MAG TPA: cation:proton antiporter [Chromatiaceae bacterium]|jgi:Kef-type K+ transport system membrane component KefB|nr:cation:proton antiporter [Chromatiaceae bacterium]HIN81851.1 cation:proton antiporter [Chromatiales bacterium]HIA08071.1 cation:proton antiporter [Chromatiaceae bacterium]HIB83303.1 cation:proton antiporter [Chromatiaceae bacterium]HIO14343.1 cation:proton antiporter [Chromatiales bacterium]